MVQVQRRRREPDAGLLSLVSEWVKVQSMWDRDARLDYVRIDAESVRGGGIEDGLLLRLEQLPLSVPEANQSEKLWDVLCLLVGWSVSMQPKILWCQR